MPLSAIVEGIFYLVAAIKTQIKLMDTLARIRTHLLGNAICAKTLVMLLTSVDLYRQNVSSSINIDETDFLEDILH